MSSTAERTSDVALVRRAVRASPTDSHPEGSAQQLARRIKTNPRTVRRWLAGDSEIRDANLRARIQRIAREAPAE